MRRILFSAGWYAAGLVTVPLLMYGMAPVSARSVGGQASRDLSWTSRDASVSCRASCQHAVKAACGASQDLPALTEAIAPSEAVFSENPATEAFPLELAQAERPPVRRVLDDDVQFFATPPEHRELTYDSPAGDALVAQPNPIVREVVLPVSPEMLATAMPDDGADAAKLAELRETLKKVMEEKALMMSATALEVEIGLHQRHLADLQALQELLKLQHNLQELSDKYPNSEAGRRAAEMLQLLNQQRRPSPRLVPTPDTFTPRSRTTPAPGTYDGTPR